MIGRVLAGRVQLALVGETEVDERIELTPFLSDEIVGVAKPGVLPIKGGRIKPGCARGADASRARSRLEHPPDCGARPEWIERAPAARLGARFERGDQASRARRSRDRFPFALCGRRGAQAGRARELSVSVGSRGSSDASTSPGSLAGL
jgi:hypothetical protein